MRERIDEVKGLQRKEMREVDMNKHMQKNKEE